MTGQYLRKEFCELAGVTIKTLRHYEELGLLTAEAKTKSGYRVYTNKDLHKLQQINTLKFLGYPLKSIKTMIPDSEHNLDNSLAEQEEQLKHQIEKSKQVLALIDKLKTVLNDEGETDWNIITFIDKLNQITQPSTHQWTLAILTQQEQEQFKQMCQMDPEQAQQGYTAFEKLCSDVRHHLDLNPGSNPSDFDGQQFAAQWWPVIEKFYAGHISLGLKLMKEAVNGNVPCSLLPPFYDKQVYQYVYDAIGIYLEKTKQAIAV